MLLFAHRGASAEAPENSLTAIRRALELGVDGIEFDLRTTADGVPVLLHDRNLARTTGTRGNVDDLTLAQVRATDAGDGAPVPTFAELLDLVGGRLRLDIEIKQAGIARFVLDELDRRPDVRWAVSSFIWDELRAVRALAPGAELWPLADDADDALFAVAAELGSPGVALNRRAYDAAIAARLRDGGLAAYVWTVNDPAEARRVRALGAAALITDDPATIRAALATP